MPTNFKPVYTINAAIAKYLMRIEAAKQKVAMLPVNPTVLASLRETAKLYTTHYSTMIEGNQLKPEEIQDGTYTFTNIGNFGSIMGTPIINQPQVGILAIGVIRKMPAVIETPKGDFIGIRRKVVLSHSYDHRIINGATGGMFVKRVAEYLENWDETLPY